jgi:serine protease AprX
VNAARADVAHAHGLNGNGVTVALLDTGIAPVSDLAGRLVDVTDDLTGRVTPCVNFSGEANCADGYGHGTFLAGIIAGDGTASGGSWTGMAPAAHLLSVKVAGRDGSADVSTVLAAIQWVVSFRDRYGIRVLNLSLGTDSTESTTDDPLNYAVERAWQSGILVVVAASNRGPGPRTISKPGDDPWVVTVGAVDDLGTATVVDDRLPSFSSRGPTTADGWAKPDLVAPGAHIVSLRAPGSEIDAQYPSSIDGAYRRGSGTSMSTAVVSGAAALAVQADPGATPDEIKQSLRVTARRVAADDVMAVGAGELDAYAAATRTPSGSANAGAPRCNGLSSLNGGRGGLRPGRDQWPCSGGDLRIAHRSASPLGPRRVPEPRLDRPYVVPRPCLRPPVAGRPLERFELGRLELGRLQLGRLHVVWPVRLDLLVWHDMAGRCLVRGLGLMSLPTVPASSLPVERIPAP